MKYLKTYESYSKDLKELESRDIRGFIKIKKLLKLKKLNLNSLLNDVKKILIDNQLGDTSTKFEIIGSGEFGIAFSYNDKVVKITTSKSEFNTCQKLQQIELEGVVKYSLSFKYKNLPIWVIIQEKLEMPNQLEKDVYTTLYYLGANDMTNSNFTFKDEKDLFEGLKERLKNPNQEDEIPSYEIEDEELKEYLKKYLNLVDVLKKQNVSVDDLHGENIGKRGNDLIHFDVMFISND
jgi:hypothetical protein